MTRTKARPAKPRSPPPNAFRGLADHPTQSIGAQQAAAKASAPSAASIEAALRLQPAQECPSRFTKIEPKQETWGEAIAADFRLLKGWCRSLGRWLARLAGLTLYALNVVVSHILAAMLYGISLVVFVLTVWELWTPAKAIADELTARIFG